MKRPIAVCAAITVPILAGCGALGRRVDRPPILIQGAMPAEVDKLVARLENVRTETSGGWKFSIGAIAGYPVVVSKTMKGAANTAAATALAAERYHPLAIVNEGTAGGHDPELHVYDIVLGATALNLGAFKTPFRERGRGSAPLEWMPMDLMASEGSAGQDPNALVMRRYPADARLLAAAKSAAQLYANIHAGGRVVEGVIGSSEVWNSELDRINWFHEQFGSSAEEMETASAAQIATEFGIPFLGVRVLSNNITNDGVYDAKTGEACQDFVYEVVKAYAGTGRR